MPARKVITPGSKRPPGRPKKKMEKKRSENYRTNFSQEALDCALNAVTSKKMTLGGAAKHYGVPKSTLYDRLKGRTVGKLGRPTTLSSEEEKELVDRLIVMASWGFPYTKKCLSFYYYTSEAEFHNEKVT